MSSKAAFRNALTRRHTEPMPNLARKGENATGSAKLKYPVLVFAIPSKVAFSWKRVLQCKINKVRGSRNEVPSKIEDLGRNKRKGRDHPLKMNNFPTPDPCNCSYGHHLAPAGQETQARKMFLSGCSTCFHLRSFLACTHPYSIS